MTDRPLRVAVVGGGIGGLAAALALHARGLDVTVFERGAGLGVVGAGVFVFPTSLRQLERLGLAPALAAIGGRVGPASRYLRMDGSVVGPIVTTDSSGWNGMYGMHRADLLNALAAALPPGAVRTGHRCTGVRQDERAAVLDFANGSTAEADVVVACDGIHSTLQAGSWRRARRNTPAPAPIAASSHARRFRAGGRRRTRSGWATASTSWSSPSAPAAC